MHAYLELEKIFRRIGALGEAESVLQWDRSVMMPSGGADARAEQLAALKLTTHEMLTSSRVSDLLDSAEIDSPWDNWQAANLAEMRRSWRHATAVDAVLVEALSKASSKCELLWRDADGTKHFFIHQCEYFLYVVQEYARVKPLAEKQHGVSVTDTRKLTVARGQAEQAADGGLQR